VLPYSLDYTVALDSLSFANYTTTADSLVFHYLALILCIQRSWTPKNLSLETRGSMDPGWEPLCRLYTKCKNDCVLRKSNRNQILLRLCISLRNTCRCSLTLRLVSWSRPVVPKVRIETQRRVEKGQKMGRAEAIQTWVAC